MGAYDRSSKWLIQHHGDSLLRLAGVTSVRSWRALQAELVQPAQLPDGLLEAELESRDQRLYLLELATYPEERAHEQLVRDALLTFLDRKALPEILVFVLSPKGRKRIRSQSLHVSPEGWADLRVRWRVIELWTIPADEVLASNEPGLMPWVPLMHFTGAPEPVFEQCRSVIERAPSGEQSTLLAVTQVLARLRYNDPALFRILGGRQPMIESPLLDELKAEWTAELRPSVLREGEAKAVIRMLESRFGQVPEDIRSALRSIASEERLSDLIPVAIRCATLAEFRHEILG
jgi:hypothetical protein